MIRKVFTISIGKFLIFLGDILHRGSTFPGSVVYKLNKNILNDFMLPKKVICVTGSSGKGTTSKIIASVYKELGYNVCYNDKDSNQRSAIITTLLRNSNIYGKINSDICVFEVDERSCKYIFPYINPTYCVITNITRDQPPRQRHIDFIYEEINKALDSNTTLILNGDDPYLCKFSLENKYNILYYGVNKQKYSYDKNYFSNLNTYRCPKCLGLLKYNYYNIEELGDYNCSKCDFRKPKINVKVTSVNYDKNEMKVNGKYTIKIKNNMLFSIYNTAGAYLALTASGLKEDKVCKIISNLNNNTKLYNHYSYNYRDVYVLNNKAENASTYNQSIFYTSRNNNVKTIVLGWKEISRRYNFDDVSWLYDVEFELLKNCNVDKFICCGPQKYDIATRLKYAKIDENKIKVFYDLYEAESEIKNSKGDIYAILNFDYVESFNEIMKEKGK